MEQNAVDCLAPKSPKAAIIDQISRDFHLVPFMVRTYFEQMQGYFEQYLDQQRDVGQMTFLAVSASTPPGRALSKCKRIAITLTLDSANDPSAGSGQGLETLWRSEIQRLTCEVQDQGALLTQEDPSTDSGQALARLLCISRPTIKRDIAHLRAEGAGFLKGDGPDGTPIAPDLAVLARVFGCHTERISTPGEVCPALEQAFAAETPVVVEVMVERTYPLSGSPAVGWWDVPVPTYLAEQRARYGRERAEER